MRCPVCYSCFVLFFNSRLTPCIIGYLTLDAIKLSNHWLYHDLIFYQDRVNAVFQHVELYYMLINTKAISSYVHYFQK